MTWECRVNTAIDVQMIRHCVHFHNATVDISKEAREREGGGREIPLGGHTALREADFCYDNWACLKFASSQSLLLFSLPLPLARVALLTINPTPWAINPSLATL